MVPLLPKYPTAWRYHGGILVKGLNTLVKGLHYYEYYITNSQYLLLYLYWTCFCLYDNNYEQNTVKMV